jgi:transcriptional regulator with XRE-family HTH domain
MATIGEKIKALAKAKDLTVPQLAKALGYDRADNFYSITSGRSKPGWEIVEAIARIFPDVNLDWLLRDHPDMFFDAAQPDHGITGWPSPDLPPDTRIALLEAELRFARTQMLEKEKRLADKDRIIDQKDKIIALLEGQSAQ